MDFAHSDRFLPLRVVILFTEVIHLSIIHLTIPQKMHRQSAVGGLLIILLCSDCIQVRTFLLIFSNDVTAL